MTSHPSSNTSTGGTTPSRLTPREICVRGFTYLSRGLGVLALFFALSFAQFINTFFFGIMVIFILAPGYIWRLFYPEGAEQEDMGVPGRENVALPRKEGRRCNTDEISECDLDDDRTLGREDDEREEESSELGERKERVGIWLKEVEE